MNYVPSPISFDYKLMYAALANPSGRMQYYRQFKGKSRIRIGRIDFIKAYNSNDILAIRPIKTSLDIPVFQFEFFI